MTQSLLEHIFRQVAHRLLFEGRLQDVINKYKDLPEDAIKDLSQNDPSGNNKYLSWMAKQLADGNEPEQIIDAVSKFHKNLSRIKTKDINQFKSLEDLQSEAEPIASTSVETNSIKIFENDEAVAIAPLSKKASCHYGSGARWCISAESENNMFNSYVLEHKIIFVFIISKTLSKNDSRYKIAIQIGRNGAITYWDKENNEHTDKNYLSETYRDDTIAGINGALKQNRGKISDKIMKKQEEEIIKSKDPEMAYQFACGVPGANIPKLEQIVIDSGDPHWAFYFARDVRGANIPKLEQIVIDSGNPERAYLFALYVPGANISRLQQVVIDSGNIERIFTFIRDIEGADVHKLQQAVIDSGDPERMFEFARDVRGANIPKMEQAIVDSEDPKWAYIFARNVAGANIPKLEQVVIDYGGARLAYEFARNVAGANIPKLEQVVIDSKNPERAYWFAVNIPGANISNLIDFVLINEPKLIKRLFDERPDLKHKYDLGGSKSIQGAY